MPTIAIIGGVKIYIYFADHAPPHFHAVFGEDEALIRISDLSVMAGRLPPAKLKRVQNWARDNQAEIALKWVQISESLQWPSKPE